MPALVAAVSVQQLVHARNGAACDAVLRPFTDAFEPEDGPILEALCAQLEGKTQRQNLRWRVASGSESSLRSVFQFIQFSRRRAGPVGTMNEVV
jgi:hypothetical protein